MEEIIVNIQLLKDEGFVKGVIDAKKPLDCKQDQVIRACRSLYEGLIPLRGETETKIKRLRRSQMPHICRKKRVQDR